MLFDLSPKESRKDLFDRETEMDALSNAIKQGERLIVLYGIRRIGKTSLLKSFLSENEFLSIFLDIRKIYFVHRRSVPADAIYEHISEGFLSLLDSLGVSSEEQIKVLSSHTEQDVTGLLSSIDKWCAAKKTRFLLVIDEAQYLRFSKKVEYDGVMAWALDNLKNVTFIVSGSEVGLLKEMLDYDNAKAPLYGRMKNEILLKKFAPDKSKEFLVKGFREAGMEIRKEEIEEVVKDLGGLIGWLAYYGHYRSSAKLSHKAALEEVFDEGATIAVSEVNALIRGSEKRYTAIMKAIASGLSTWADIKAYVVGKAGKISDSVLDKLITSLIKFSVVEKGEDGKYEIVDPILKSFLLR